MNIYKQIILSLVAFNASLHIAHWSADTLTNEHKALGDLYDEMDELTDTLAEVVLGRLGDRSFDPASANQLVVPYRDSIPSALGLVSSLISTASAENAQDIITIAADMQKALNHAKYFLGI